jgi:hypothetical protein
MRGTDPTKSKWECPTMFYVCNNQVNINLLTLRMYHGKFSG